MFKIAKVTLKVFESILSTVTWLWAVACGFQLLTEPSDLLLVAGIAIVCGVSGAYLWFVRMIWRKNENKTV